MALSSRWGRPDVHAFPVFNGHVPGIALAPFAAFGAALGVGVATGALRVRFDRVSLVLLSGIVPGTLALLCFAKIGLDDRGQTIAWLAWNYPLVLLVAALLLAVRGLDAMARLELPHWVRGFGLLVLAFTTTASCLDGLNVAARLRSVDRAYEEAYRRVAQNPIRTVYTHWPLIYENPDGMGMDNGRLRWKSDGWRVRNIRELRDESLRPERPSVLMWDVYRDYDLPASRLESLGRRIETIEATDWDSSLLLPFGGRTRRRVVVSHLVEE